MTEEKKFKRQCCYCKSIKDKKDLIRITKNYKDGSITINQKNEIQGRSVYICKKNECLENAIKKRKIEVFLKSGITENIKNELFDLLQK